MSLMVSGSSSSGTPSAAAQQADQNEEEDRESMVSLLRMQLTGVSVNATGCLEQAVEFWDKLKGFGGVGNALNRLRCDSLSALACFRKGVMHTIKKGGVAPLRILMPVGVAVHLLQEVENTRDNRRLLARSGLLRVSVPQAARQVKDMFT